jgi:dynamin 1-like protein
MRFPNVIDDINEIVGKVLKDEKDIAKELIEGLIMSEQTYIFTNDIGYITSRTSIIPTGGEGKEGEKPKKIDPEKLFIDEMRSRIDAYFCIVLRNIRDSIPKIIGHFLVKSVQETLQYSLYNEINKNEQLTGQVGEPPHITAERETLNKVLEVLQRAKRVLTKDPDLAPQFAKETAPTNIIKPSFSPTKIPISSESDNTKKTVDPSALFGGPTQNPSQNPSQNTTQNPSQNNTSVQNQNKNPPSTTPPTNNNQNKKAGGFGIFG